jgi:hypothetical protein
MIWRQEKMNMRGSRGFWLQNMGGVVMGSGKKSGGENVKGFETRNWEVGNGRERVVSNTVEEEKSKVRQ